MKKYNRIKLQLTDLPPKSVSNVFLFIDKWLEDNNLNQDYFINSIERYTIGERYFIFEYTKQYFSDKQQSYLNRWFKKQLGGQSYEEESKNYVSTIVKEVEAILRYISKNEATIERQFKISNKKEDSFYYVKSNPINYRIPLYYLINIKNVKKLLKKTHH